MNRRTVSGLAALTLLAALAAGCGVDSEDAPRPIRETTEQPDTTPSVDTRPAPTSGAPSSTPTPTSSPPSTTATRLP